MSILKRINDRRLQLGKYGTLDVNTEILLQWYLEDTVVLLEALATESSGRYGGGFYCMERALKDADAYNKKHKTDPAFVPDVDYSTLEDS